MKILFQSRLDLFDKRGGDTIQMLETKVSLEKLGIAVDINCSLNLDVSSYDIVHIFNLDWVCETYPQIYNAKKQGKKVILSPIHHSQEEFERYENKSRYGLMKLGNFLIPNQPLREEARNLVKGIIYPKKLKPAVKQLLMGIRRQQKESIEMSDYILVQTNLEAKDLKKDFGVPDFKWVKVVNGIDGSKFKGQSSKVKIKSKRSKVILCVGRVEPRKNQLNLIKAFKRLEDKEVKLIFVGALNKYHPTYINKFLTEVKMSKGTIIYRGFVEQSKLCELYSSATVFACPSWFETTGLVYLEAAVCDVSSIVASGERAKEYLGNSAIYCDPGSVESIKDSLEVALQKETVKGGFADLIKKTYTWDECAKQTLTVYKELVNN